MSKAYPHLNKQTKENIALEIFGHGHPEGDMRMMALMTSSGTVEEQVGLSGPVQWAKKEVRY